MDIFQFHFLLMAISFMFCYGVEAASPKDDGELLASNMSWRDGRQTSQRINAGMRHDGSAIFSGRGLQSKKGHGENDCTALTTRSELESAIVTATAATTASSRVVNMCAGTISVGSETTLSLPNPVTVRCSKPKACFITAESDYSAYFVYLGSGSLSFVGIVASDFQRIVFDTAGGTTLTLRDSEFHNNGPGSFSGGVVSAIGNVNIFSCLFRGNTAWYAGGAIAQYGPGKLTVTKSRFESNEVNPPVSYGGGAINLEGADAALEKTVFQTNGTGKNGGAVRVVSGSHVNVTKGCSFENNAAGDSGGAIFVDSSSLLSHTKIKFKGNIAGNKCNNIFYEEIGGPLCGP